MNWTAQDLHASPVTFELRRADGLVVSTLRWNRDVKGGAYVDNTRTVSEPRFCDAQEAVVRASIHLLDPDEIPDRFSKGRKNRTHQKNPIPPKGCSDDARRSVPILR